MTGWVLAAFLYHVLSRLLYVLWVGRTLKQEELTGHYTRTFGETGGFARFRHTAALIMNNDAVSFVLLCIIARDTLPHGYSRLWLLVLGGVLTIVGLGMKLWARAAVGPDRYYWRDFFGPPPPATAPVGGPYRFFRNPMYTIGNVHLAGLALMAASGPALVAGLFSHVAILVFNYVVERPHVQRLYGA